MVEVESRRKRRMRITLSQKFIVGFILLSILLSGGLCYLGYRSISDKYMEFYSARAVSAAGIAANLVNADDIARYLKTGVLDARYEEILDELNVVKQHTGMQYIYIFYPHPDGYQYVYDAMNQSETPEDVCAFGAIEPYVGPNPVMRGVFETGKPVINMLVTDTQAGGYVGTVFAPVFDSKGDVVALSGVDVAMPEVKSELQKYLINSLSTSVAMVVLIVLLYLLYLRRSVIAPLLRLTRSVNDYTKDEQHLKYVPAQVRTGDEIEQLAGSFEQMAEDINTYMQNLQRVTADKQRIATELDVATNIQLSMLPRVFPPFPQCANFDIFATINTAKEVGGDFYDFFRLDEDRLCFLIADVSGKGVPAALFMMIAKALVKNQAQGGASLAESFTNANNQLCDGNEINMFVTALIMVLNTREHTLTWCNAGHNPPMIRHKDGAFEYLKIRRSLPLAAMENIRYREESCPFGAGDMIFLYTDGVTEATDSAEELYGEARLSESINAIAHPETLPLEKLLIQINRDMDHFVNGAPQADDITMLAVRTNI